MVYEGSRIQGTLPTIWMIQPGSIIFLFYQYHWPHKKKEKSWLAQDINILIKIWKKYT